MTDGSAISGVSIYGVLLFVFLVGFILGGVYEHNRK